MKYILLVLVFIVGLFRTSLSGQDSLAQVEEPRKFIEKSSLIVLPLAFYTPETRFGGGVGGLYAFRFGNEPEESRPSQVELGLAYTQNEQILLYLPFFIYSDNERWFYSGELGYYRYVYQYFGIGNETPQEGEIYQANYPRVRLNVQRRLGSSVYVGLRYWFDDYRISEKEDLGLLATTEVTGSNGGIVSGLGAIADWDTRDEVFFPTKGRWYKFVTFFNRKQFGSDFNFARFSFDGSEYIPIGKKNVLALNGFVDFLSGDVPFQQLALIGGPRKMRGYFEGRFRDKNLWMFQAEYRWPIKGIFGMTFFANAASVAPDLNTLLSEQVHFAGGLGLRIRLSKEDKVNLRVDLGINEEGQVFPYFTVGEAF
jgi:outer membrane protein assembly factor BamA